MFIMLLEHYISFFLYTLVRPKGKLFGFKTSFVIWSFVYPSIKGFYVYYDKYTENV